VVAGVQVISIVTAGAADGMGLFFPNGLNGAINGSSASAALLSNDIAGRRKLLVSSSANPEASCCHMHVSSWPPSVATRHRMRGLAVGRVGRFVCKKPHGG